MVADAGHWGADRHHRVHLDHHLGADHPGHRPPDHHRDGVHRNHPDADRHLGAADHQDAGHRGGRRSAATGERYQGAAGSASPTATADGREAAESVCPTATSDGAAAAGNLGARRAAVSQDGCRLARQRQARNRRRRGAVPRLPVAEVKPVGRQAARPESGRRGGPTRSRARRALVPTPDAARPLWEPGRARRPGPLAAQPRPGARRPEPERPGPRPPGRLAPRRAARRRAARRRAVQGAPPPGRRGRGRGPGPGPGPAEPARRPGPQREPVPPSRRQHEQARRRARRHRPRGRPRRRRPASTHPSCLPTSSSAWALQVARRASARHARRAAGSCPRRPRRATTSGS